MSSPNVLDVAAVAHPWDPARANAVLAEVLGAIQAARRGKGLSETRRRVLDVFAEVFRRFHDERDSLLWDARADVENQLRVVWNFRPGVIGEGT